MITGAVTSSLEAVLRLEVHGTAGQRTDVEAVIDTGFNDFLALPKSLIATLALPWHSSTPAQLGDGSSVTLDLYRGTVTWDGQPRDVPVVATQDGTAVGMSLFQGYRLTMEVVPGGSVLGDPLP